jgi:hypothetical protein
VKYELKKTIIAAVTAFMAATILAYAESGTEAAQKLGWWLLCFLAGVAVFLAVFLVILFRTPAVLAHEAHAGVQAELGRLRDDVARLKAASEETLER